MSTLRQLAVLIPAEYRKEILELDLIGTAYCNTQSLEMVYLAKVYKAHLEPDFDATCGLCLSRCLDAFKRIQPEMIALQKEEELLNHE